MVPEIEVQEQVSKGSPQRCQGIPSVRDCSGSQGWR